MTTAKALAMDLWAVEAGVTSLRRDLSNAGETSLSAGAAKHVIERLGNIEKLVGDVKAEIATSHLSR